MPIFNTLMSTYIILNAYLQYFKNIYNGSAQLEMISHRDRLSQEFVNIKYLVIKAQPQIGL